jgi:hypothetical protein
MLSVVETYGDPKNPPYMAREGAVLELNWRRAIKFINSQLINKIVQPLPVTKTAFCTPSGFLCKTRLYTEISDHGHPFLDFSWTLQILGLYACNVQFYASIYTAILYMQFNCLPVVVILFNERQNLIRRSFPLAADMEEDNNGGLHKTHNTTSEFLYSFSVFLSGFFPFNFFFFKSKIFLSQCPLWIHVTSHGCVVLIHTFPTGFVCSPCCQSLSPSSVPPASLWTCTQQTPLRWWSQNLIDCFLFSQWLLSQSAGIGTLLSDQLVKTSVAGPNKGWRKRIGSG